MQEKKLTLKSAFVEVFGAGLAPLGFVRLKKTKLPFFVRLINNEIIHVITCHSTRSFEYGYHKFEILAGVATVYRKQLNLGDSLIYHLNWLYNTSKFYNMAAQGTDVDGSDEIPAEFSYQEQDESSMYNEMQHALEIVTQITMPVLNGVVDLQSCIEYFYQFHSGLLVLNQIESPSIANIETLSGESLILIKADYRNDYEERWRSELAGMEQGMIDGKIGYTRADFEIWRTETEKSISEQYQIRMQLLNTPHLHALAIQEADRRKAVNTELLRAHGLPL